MNILRLENTRTRTQEKALLKLVVQDMKNQEVDAMDCTRHAVQKFGLYADWHEFSYLLDDMRTRGQIEHVRIDRGGRNIYRIL